ncbi:MAG: Gfo/Idh/MocA family oxidoreductase [Gemmataceae bacterium]
MDRRDFLTTSSAAVATGVTILPSGTRAGPKAPSNRLNIALIGVWGRGLAHTGWLSDENVVALCDVNETRFADGLKKYPKAKTYVDWRKCLDQKGLDAVVCCTTDHTHAFIGSWALNRDLHVYMEKPLAITVDEARLVRAKWLKKKDKLATQVGMQRHEHPNFNRVREMIRDGAVGELTSACAWGDRQIRRAGYLPAKGKPPEGLHYDLWLGPSPEHPYNPGYFSGGPGANCLQWNMFWDFGAGQIGDMGSHTMDLLWNAVDARIPTAVEARGEKFNADVTPVECESHFDHPANDWRGPIRVSWYQGGAMPKSPVSKVDLRRIGHGAMFVGTKGVLVADFGANKLYPLDAKGDLTHYKPRATDKQLPPVGNFMRQWVKACKNPNLKTACDFEYSGDMIEQLLLGLVAYRAGKKLTYDPVAGRVTNSSEANEFLGKKYRAGWTLEG